MPELEFAARTGGDNDVRLDLPDLSRFSVKYLKRDLGMQETVWAQQIREFHTYAAGLGNLGDSIRLIEYSRLSFSAMRGIS